MIRRAALTSPVIIRHFSLCASSFAESAFAEQIVDLAGEKCDDALENDLRSFGIGLSHLLKLILVIRADGKVKLNAGAVLDFAMEQVPVPVRTKVLIEHRAAFLEIQIANRAAVAFLADDAGQAVAQFLGNNPAGFRNYVGRVTSGVVRVFTRLVLKLGYMSLAQKRIEIIAEIHEADDGIQHYDICYLIVGERIANSVHKVKYKNLNRIGIG